MNTLVYVILYNCTWYRTYLGPWTTTVKYNTVLVDLWSIMKIEITFCWMSNQLNRFNSTHTSLYCRTLIEILLQCQAPTTSPCQHTTEKVRKECTGDHSISFSYNKFVGNPNQHGGRVFLNILVSYQGPSEDFPKASCLFVRYLRIALMNESIRSMLDA
jgi:hypothetical protein